MTRNDIKEKMQQGNIFASEKKQTPEGSQIHYLKGCYHCRAKFIAKRISALTCSHSCGTSVNRKLAKGKDLSNVFSIRASDVENTVELDKYPFWKR